MAPDHEEYQRTYKEHSNWILYDILKSSEAVVGWWNQEVERC